MSRYWIVPLLLFVMMVGVFPAFAEQVIFSEGKEYEIDTITKDYKMNKNSQIAKTQGYTTTGEMFFLRVASNFEKVMLLDTFGSWHKAEMKEKIVEELEPANSVVAEDKTELHYILDQYERVYNKADYKFFIKTFDKSIYSGNDFQTFQGKISGAKISAIIIDPDGEIKSDFEGFVEDGLYEGTVSIPENLWQRGWYTVDIVIEFDEEFYYDQISFYVFGTTAPDGGTATP